MDFYTTLTTKVPMHALLTTTIPEQPQYVQQITPPSHVTFGSVGYFDRGCYPPSSKLYKTERHLELRC